MKKILFTALAVFSVAMSSASVTVGAATGTGISNVTALKAVAFSKIAIVDQGPSLSGTVEITYQSTLSLVPGKLDGKYYVYEVDGVERSAAYYL